jgi:hypothetical protein
MTMDPVIDHTIRLALQGLFLVAAAHKLRDVRAFRQTLAAHRIVPDALVPLAAALVVAAEVVAFLLTSRDEHRAGLAIGGALLLLYAGVIALNLVRGRDRIDCGCLGVAGRDGLSWWLVGRNLLCATAAFAALLPSSGRAMGAIDSFTVYAATSALVALYVAADRLIANADGYRRLHEAV